MVPQWLALLIAGAVILFGIYRLWLDFGGPSDEERAEHLRGLYAMPRRQHGLIGIIFLIIAGARGVSPIEGLVLGSVADRLLNAAPCSLLLAHPTNKPV